MLHRLVAALLALPLMACRAASPPSPPAARTVTLLHVSDYHSHAAPFFSEGRADQGGIARFVAYARAIKSRGDALVLSGGDTMNHGTPAWSDKYRCFEWRWLDGIVDAMAFGNHDADYGWRELDGCRRSVSYPVLGANVLDANGGAALTRYAVGEVRGVRVGLFALAGPDFPALLAKGALGTGMRVADRSASIRIASEIVAELRGRERADLVVFLGHENAEDDAELARRVPGIDVIFGTHSHRKVAFGKIEGTQTYTLSGFQYGAYVAKVEATVRDHAPPEIRGELVPMDAKVTPDPNVAAYVARLTRDLEADPAYAERFAIVGAAPSDLIVDGIDTGGSSLGEFVLGAMRDATKADVALSAASSFRASIPRGDVRREDLLTALPYPNRVLSFRVDGKTLRAILDESAARRGTGLFLAATGMSENELDPARVYLVATTDFVASHAASPYRRYFAASEGGPGPTVAELVEARLARSHAERGGQVR